MRTLPDGSREMLATCVSFLRAAGPAPGLSVPDTGHGQRTRYYTRGGWGKWRSVARSGTGAQRTTVASVASYSGVAVGSDRQSGGHDASTSARFHPLGPRTHDPAAGGRRAVRRGDSALAGHRGAKRT